MIIEIDQHSGFCFGVQRAVNQAEELMENGTKLFSLGKMVHNAVEVERLNKLGMTTVNHSDLDHLSGTVLFRSHGEPPETYQKAREKGLKFVDATCPVVLKLQQRVKAAFQKMNAINGQLVIFGKKDHPETIGLNGQTGYKAIVVSGIADIELIDFSRPIEIFSQTTMPVDGLHELINGVKKRAQNEVLAHDTICRQVANRLPRMSVFASSYDVILFVSGKDSSNGKMLFSECLKHNDKTFFLSSADEVDFAWFENATSIGITGATSTPTWLMKLIRDHIIETLNIRE